jgi:hypothetical protein
MLIHIARDGKEIGEFTEEELQLRLTDRSVVPTDYVWFEGMDSWQLVHQVFKIEWPRHQGEIKLPASHDGRNTAKPKFLYGAPPRK